MRNTSSPRTDLKLRSSYASARVSPGGFWQIGPFAYFVVKIASLVIGTRTLNLFATLARHGRLFRGWLVFAATLLGGGPLSRKESELIILRVAALSECAYEWSHHIRLARRAGNTLREIAQVRRGASAAVYSARVCSLLRATDDLHRNRVLSDGTWADLREHLDERAAIELCLLVGHYEMLAMTLNSLRVPLDLPRRQRRDGLAQSRP
jgi:AhpD family alkylhydroperoxidase